MARKRTVNKTMVGVLTAVGFVAVTAAGVMLVQSLKRSDPVHWVQMAEAAAAQQDWQQAKFYYWRANQVSRDPKYLVDVGRMEHQSGEEFRAGQVWLEAIAQNPGLIEAHEALIDLRTEIADLYRQSTSWLRLKEAAEGLLAVDAQNPKALFALGYAYMELYKATKEKDGGSVRKGFENIRRAVQLAPEVVHYSIALATYQIDPQLNPGTAVLERHEEVERLLQRLRAEHTEPGEDAARVRFTYARFLGALGRHDEAVEAFKQAEALAGDDKEIRARVKNQEAQYWSGRWYSAVNAQSTEDVDTYFENARRLLEESIQLDEEGFLQYLLLAELHAYRGDHLEAIQTCERRINKPISRVGLKYSARKYARYLLLVKAADECLIQAASLDRTSADFDALIARAGNFCELALAEFPVRGEALHTMGKVKLAMGNELESITLFQQAKEAYGAPNWRNSKTLAQLLLRHNQPGAAMETIKSALEDEQADPTCWGVAAQIALELKDPVTALRYVETVLRRQPGNREALRLKMHALRQQGDTELADAIAEALGEIQPGDVLQEAERLQTEGQTGEAIRALTAFLDNSPDNVPVLRQAVSLLVAAGRHQDAKSLVERGLAASPDSYEIRLLGTMADPQLTEAQRDDAQREIIKSIADPVERNYQMAVWYGERGMKEEYVAALGETERLLQSPDDTHSQATKRRYLQGIIERQFVFAVNAGSQDQVNAIVDMAVKENIDGADGLTYRGRAQMAARQPELALASFKQALAKQPANARTLSYVGQCHLSLEPPQLFEAKTYFERAAGANPNLGIAQKGLAIVARLRGEEGEYAQRLAAAARLLPDDPWIKEQMLLQREQDRPETALARREEIRKNDPNNMENLRALADLYSRTNRVDKARECYEAILQTGEADARTVVAASKFFRENGDAPRALQVLEDLIARTPEPQKKADRVLLVADYWHTLGDRDQAEAALARAAGIAETLQVCTGTAKFKTDIGDYDAALDWFGRAIELADASSPELAAFLRRSRIDVLFRKHDHEAAAQAVSDFVQRYPEDVSGLLLTSAIHTVRGEIDEAITYINRYLEKKPEDLNAMHQRARLYFTQGRYAAAIRDLERIRSIDPKYRDYAARLLLADGYVLTNRLDLAYEGLESIVQNDPAAKDVAVHLIVLYREHERYTEATRVCTSMANRYPNDPIWVKNRGDIRAKMKDMPSALADYELAARLSGFRPHYTAALLRAFTDANMLDKGITYYTQTIPADRRTPSVVVRYAELLARSGRIAEAIPQFLDAFERGGFADLSFVQDLVGSVVNACTQEGDEKVIDLFRADPDNPRLKRSAEHILAMILTHYKYDSEALSLMQRLLETAADRSEKIMLLATMGNVYERQENWEAAKKAYEDLLKIDDRHLLGLNNLAFLLSDKLNRPREAIPYARQAALLYPIKSVRDTLAWTHVKLGEYRTAIAILTETLEEDPRYVPGIYHLAEAYRRDKDLDKAASLLEGANNLIEEGVGETYRMQVRKAIADVRRGETAP